MNLGFLFGPRYEHHPARGHWALRSITTDLDVLTDALDVMLDWWDPDHILRSADGAEVLDSYSTVRGDVAADKLNSLGAYERRTLRLARVLVKADGTKESISIDCGMATVTLSSAPTSRAAREIVEFIMLDSRPRLTWRRLRYLVPMVLILAIGIGYFGVLTTSEFNVYAHVLVLSLVVAAMVGLVFWASAIARAQKDQFGSIRVRAQSRTETEAKRADRHANIRVALITAIVIAPVTIAVTLISKSLTGG